MEAPRRSAVFPKFHRRAIPIIHGASRYEPQTERRREFRPQSAQNSRAAGAYDLLFSATWRMHKNADAATA